MESEESEPVQLFIQGYEQCDQDMVSRAVSHAACRSVENQASAATSYSVLLPFMHINILNEGFYFIQIVKLARSLQVPGGISRKSEPAPAAALATAPAAVAASSSAAPAQEQEEEDDFDLK